MNFKEAEVLTLLAQGEGRTIEFKRGLPRDERVARTIAAFANTRGGILFVGVGDRGEVLGAPHPQQTVETLRAVARRVLEPEIVLEITLVRVRGKPIVCCSVPLSPQRPHAVVHADGTHEVVVRAGSSNRVATGPTLTALDSARGRRRGLTPLERRALEWLDARSRHGATANSDATAVALAHACNLGKQRARRVLVDLERDGFVVGHGLGACRVYARA